MDHLDLQIMDYARQKGGWFTCREVREALGLDYNRQGWVGRHLKSLVNHRFLTSKVDYMYPDKFLTCTFYRDVEVEDDEVD